MFFIPPDIPSVELSRSDFGLSENKNLYCCPQSLFKIHPDFDEALHKIVNNDKDSQIIMIEAKYKKHKEIFDEIHNICIKIGEPIEGNCFTEHLNIHNKRHAISTPFQYYFHDLS